MQLPGVKALHSDLPTRSVVCATDNEAKIFAKCGSRLIPFLVLLFVVNFLDRVNVGFAALAMNRDLGFSPAVYGFGAGVFFLGYALFGIPATLLLERVGARLGLCCMLAPWGILSACCAFVWSPGSFYTMRFLLGVAEAGFQPGIYFYLSLWFPEARRARAIALFMLGGPISNIVVGPLSALLLGMDNIAGLHGWQWLFLVEGLPAFLLAFLCLKWLPDGPGGARWLSDSEKTVIASRLSNDPPARHTSARTALQDPRLIFLALAWFGITSSIYGFDLWLPQIVQALGFSNLQIGFIASSMFAIGAISQYLVARSSDAQGERIWHIAVPTLMAAAAWVACATFGAAVLPVLIALTLVRLGLNSTFGPILALPLSFLGGSAAASGAALMTVLGGLGGFASSFAMGNLKETTGGYAAGMAVLAAGLVVSVAIVLALGHVMAERKMKVA
jgi:MFS transporter, ACS family, tartrate transporter